MHASPPLTHIPPRPGLSKAVAAVDSLTTSGLRALRASPGFRGDIQGPGSLPHSLKASVSGPLRACLAMRVTAPSLTGRKGFHRALCRPQVVGDKPKRSTKQERTVWERTDS